MKIFKLPDLGEGLPDAQIREWYVNIGDIVKTDQPLVAMETAKALVDVPAPFSGKVEKLFGNSGDTIDVGEPLIGFEGEAIMEPSKDAGTVVGTIEEGDTYLAEKSINNNINTSPTRVKATPAVRMLAKQLGIDLNQIAQNNETVTAEMVKAAAQQPPQATYSHTLSQARRAMVMSMTKAHQEIVPVTICDDADISAWQGKADITVKLLRALCAACQKEPILNAYFDGKQLTYELNDQIHVGLAIDTPHGLFVPVIKNVLEQTDEALRETINHFKQHAHDRSFTQEVLQGATIMLSNFGSIAGRYANPIILPPMVAILGVGQLRNEVVARNNEMQIHPILPISLTFDHRAVTGGEAARFLRTFLDALAS